MLPGKPDLIILILIFAGLQAWWIIPLFKKNNSMIERDKDLREEIKQLEKLYKK